MPFERTSISPARLAALDVLLAVERGGYASDLLREIDCDERDAGLASEIVFGVLRFRAQLDWLIVRATGRPAERMDAEVLAALRMGIYQLRHLDRVPAHAAVNESVELARHCGKGAAAGLVNAVLRKMNRAPVKWPNRATELSVPAWMLTRWEQRHGAPLAAGIAAAFLKAPETYVRAPEGRLEGLDLEPTDVAGCYRVRAGRPEPSLMQDIGSQAIVGLLDLKPGMSFLDVCAAPGNKTAQALEAQVRAIACDVSWKRLVGLKRLGCPLVQADGAAALPFSARFDRILVDAPCSGTGTIGRNPEIKWRVQPTEFASQHARQVRLLIHALERLGGGGKLVYSTCSLEREENCDVVYEALEAHDERFRFASVVERLPGRDAGDGFYAAVITSNEPPND
jgi:16S rRNA (cytosine967-C5)-methyltransferase